MGVGRISPTPYDSNQPNKPSTMNLTPTQVQNLEKLDAVHSFVFDVLDRSRYEMAERNQPIYGNPAYREGKRMMHYEYDCQRTNCVELYKNNLAKCIRVLLAAGLVGAATSLKQAVTYLQK